MEGVNPSKLFSVKDMVVVITGGATGIGLMMTKAFANNGAAKVYIMGRRKEKLEEAAKEASPHGNVVPIVGDVTSKESLLEVAEQVRRETGYVNLLCCNSGTYPKPLGIKPSEVSVQDFAKKALEQNTEDWNSCELTKHSTAGFATNTTSVAFTTFAFLELLDAGNKQGNCAGRHSQVIVTSSLAGYLRNANTFGCYPITKGAATHLVRLLSSTLVSYGIRVNALAPGLFPSDLAADLIARLGNSDKEPTEQGAFPRSLIPEERIGCLEDMAGTILYMASPAGAYLNGETLLIDGGRLASTGTF